MPEKNNNAAFVNWFRHAAPYIKAHRGRTFVIAFGGEFVADARFPHFIHDVALLNTLGVRLVLVHGARPQIEQCLRERGVKARYHNGLRVTDSASLACVKQAAGALRVEIEALLSMGVANSPMAGARIRAASGNFITARPLGVRGGVDFEHTGEVRRVDAQALQKALDDNAVVLISPLGYSPTGEVFNLSAEDVATAVAVELRADKLLCLTEGPGLVDGKKRLVRQVTLNEAQKLLSGKCALDAGMKRHLACAVQACRNGVRRAHLISRRADGALLLELFTRDGIGTLIAGDAYEDTRAATIEDVGGILELIAPLEQEGVLVRRSRERLETEIGHFTVMERDGAVIACAALYPYAREHVGELACLAVHPDYRDAGRGEALLEQVERKARQQKIKRLFVLTTHAPHWFAERGFHPGSLQDLPVDRQQLYNYQRNSKVFVKKI
ncbi:MAG: amino-acid N-acetyltransferase [Gammaproteobacteria bacterium]|nr:MAG: amino-acid N-acetyltransferase [Gammaproteobacteria bacterium]